MRTTMRAIWGVLFLSLFVPIALQAHTRQDNVKTIVAKTKELYKNTTTAKITFTQTAAGSSVSGTLEYSTGNKFRLTLPDRTIVSDGSKTWTYIKERNQVIVNKAASGGQITPNDILRSFPGDYTSTLNGTTKVGGKDAWIVNCTATGAARVGDINSATLYIDKNTHRFHKITVTSPTLGTMTLDIGSAQYNLSLAASRFTFSAPTGATVVDLSK